MAGTVRARATGSEFSGSARPAGRRITAAPGARTSATAQVHGSRIDGGFAERTVADERFCFDIPSGYPDLQAAPLLCAGLIGHRALRMTGDPAYLAAAKPAVRCAECDGRPIAEA